MKETGSVRWDKRQQKLIRKTVVERDLGKEKGSKQKGKVVIQTVETYDKHAAKNLLKQTKSMHEYALKYANDCEECKALAEKAKDLPHYDEIMKVLRAQQWLNDKNMVAAYPKAKADAERLGKNLADLEKVLPAKL